MERIRCIGYADKARSAVAAVNGQGGITMPQRQMGWGEWLAEVVLAVLGIVMTLCWPMAWIAWLPGMSWVVLGTAVGCGTLYCLIYWLKGPAPEEVGLPATPRERFWSEARLSGYAGPRQQPPREPTPAPQFRITWKH